MVRHKKRYAYIVFDGGKVGMGGNVWKEKRDLLQLVKAVVARQHGSLGAAEAAGFAIPFVSPAGAFVVRGSANAIDYLKTALAKVQPVIDSIVAKETNSSLAGMRNVRLRATAGSIAQVFRALLPQHLAQLHKEVRQATGLQAEDSWHGDGASSSSHVKSSSGKRGGGSSGGGKTKRKRA